MNRLLLALLFVGVAITGMSPDLNASTSVFTPGAIWLDSAGNVIQAHAPGIIRVKKTWYWFGEDKTDGSPFQNVRCYASDDLEHWSFKSDALTRQASGDLGPNRIIERPKVIFNRRTRTYVMYVHVDAPNYREAKVGVATSKKVEGPYTYIGSFSPLGQQSRDMTLFQDDDGAGYLIFEDRKRGDCIARLSDDYLTVDHQVCLIQQWYEAPAVIKVGGLYYLLGSHLSGWATNPNEYATATSLAGPWSDFKQVAPSSPNTFDSQTAYIVPVFGTKTTTYIYCGDRWKSDNLTDSRYIWMPIQIGGGQMLLSSDQPWSIDMKTGIVTQPYTQ